MTANDVMAERIIVLADRDPRVRELATHFLVAANFRVEPAADGLVAFEKVRELVPALLITEVLLPKLDGLALCRRLKADDKTARVPVLVLSVLAVQGRAGEAGADDFMMKPVLEERLLRAVSDVLKRTAPQGS